MKSLNFRTGLLLCILLGIKTASGQINPAEFARDSVGLSAILEKVIETHPSVQKAIEAMNAVEAGIGLTKSARYPEINADAGYTRIGPVPSISIPELGSFNMAPADNYHASVSIYQTLTDFSRTTKKIKEAETGKEIAGRNLGIVRDKLSMMTISCFYALDYLQQAVRIKESQLAILEKHLDFVIRKNETGSATDYEILSTRVRISAAGNQKLDLETALGNQLAVLNSLLGLPEDTKIRVKSNYFPQDQIILADTLINYALRNRNELIVTGLRKSQAELHLETLKAANNPVVTAFASGGIKNGYFPDLNQAKLNFAAGLGITVPVFTAGRHKNQLQIASSDIRSINQDLELDKRNISSEVYQNAATLSASARKIEESELQLSQASEALRLADLSFRSGSITNLDLLDAESFEAESRLNLLKAKTEYMINAAILQLSTGKKLY